MKASILVVPDYHCFMLYATDCAGHAPRALSCFTCRQMQTCPHLMRMMGLKMFCTLCVVQPPSGAPWITQQTMFCIPTGIGRSSLILQGFISAAGSKKTPKILKMVFRRVPVWCALIIQQQWRQPATSACARHACVLLGR